MCDVFMTIDKFGMLESSSFIYTVSLNVQNVKKSLLCSKWVSYFEISFVGE